MIQDILSDPLKLTMAIILAVLEVPAAIVLAILWRRAVKEASKRGEAIES